MKKIIFFPLILAVFFFLFLLVNSMAIFSAEDMRIINNCMGFAFLLSVVVSVILK